MSIHLLSLSLSFCLSFSLTNTRFHRQTHFYLAHNVSFFPLTSPYVLPFTTCTHSLSFFRNTGTHIWWQPSPTFIALSVYSNSFIPLVSWLPTYIVVYLSFCNYPLWANLRLCSPFYVRDWVLEQCEKGVWMNVISGRRKLQASIFAHTHVSCQEWGKNNPLLPAYTRTRPGEATSIYPSKN